MAESSLVPPPDRALPFLGANPAFPQGVWRGPPPVSSVVPRKRETGRKRDFSSSIGWNRLRTDDRTTDHTDITDEDEKTRIASASFIAEPAASVAKLELRNEGKAGASQRKVLFANQIMP
jgi:hypothetical protein